MDSQQFRAFGKAAIDLLADYYDNIRDRDVLPSVEPGHFIKNLPGEAPETPEDWENVLKEFSDTILPGVTHWQSPNFHGYFPSGSSFASTIGALLSDGLGIMGFTWIASPICTELEVVTMNWLGKMIGLPEEFLNCSSGPGGGVIQSTASETTLLCLLAAKDKMIRRLKKINPSLDVNVIRGKLVAYTSDQCNSSVEKAGALGSMTMKLLKTDSNGRLRGETLKKAFEKDKVHGLIPCYVVANLGTTSTCAFDPLNELGPICQEENVWLHVDAAYAGSAFICPEYRHLMRGIEYVDSFVINTHKWLLVTFDLSALWVKDGYDLVKTFDVQRIYLDDVNDPVKVPDYRHWQMPLGRRFRSIKLWMVLKIYGVEGLQKYIRNHITLAQYFAKLVRADDRFIIEPEPAMGLVCFRLESGDKITRQLLDTITKKKKLYMIAGEHRNRLVIRFVVCSRLTTAEDIDFAWNTIKEETNVIYNENTHMKSKSIPTVDNLKTITLHEKSK